MLYDEDFDGTFSIIPEEGPGAISEAGRPLGLGDFISGVLGEKVAIEELENRRENAFGIAMGLAARLINTAYGINPLYPKYLSARGGKPELENLRALDADNFQCFVPIKRPIQPDTFKMVYKPPGEYPSHRILLSVNDGLFSVEKLQISKEWGHCVDTNGFLRPDFILRWFNDGLIAAADFLREARPQKAKRHHTMDITYSAKKDGTLLIHFYTNESVQEHLYFNLNIVPCIPIMEVPRQCRLQVPIASRRPYYEMHTDFKNKVKETLTKGEKMFYLGATIMPWTHGCPYDGSIVCSWGLNIGCLEDRSLNYICEMRTGKYFRDVIMLIERIKDVHVCCLHPLTNRVVLNAILYQHKKSMGLVKARSRWFIKIMERISSHLKSGVFPAFFQNKYNLLRDYKAEMLLATAKELDDMLEDLADMPENIYLYTGLDGELEDIDETKPYRDEPVPVPKVEEVKPPEPKEDTDEDSLFDRTITTAMSNSTARSYTFCDEDSDEEPVFITSPVRYGFKRHQIRSASELSGQMNSRPASGQLNSRLASGQLNSRPAPGQLNSRPAPGQLNSRPAPGQLNSRPASAQFNSRPASGQFNSQPASANASTNSIGQGSANFSLRSVGSNESDDKSSMNDTIKSADNMSVNGSVATVQSFKRSRKGSAHSVGSTTSIMSINGLTSSVGIVSGNMSKGSVGKISGNEPPKFVSKDPGHVHTLNRSNSRVSLQSSTYSSTHLPRLNSTFSGSHDPGNWPLASVDK